MKRSALIILILSLPLLSISCSTEPDYSTSWIKYSTFDDYAHNHEQEVTGDTIYASFTTPEKPLILQVNTQSSDGSSPRFFRTIDEGERMEITNEVPMGGFYEHDNGTTKHIKEIEVMIPSNLYSAGQILKYETMIGPGSGIISKTVYLMIQ
ncbi:hypothetical protein SAMN06296241_1205 [Salinimicrobium sediminis]|uniref:Uncharacterized protein n=1 Tax=Salinimicrobium sediminis TaxID=1343891 RepID=A0A285X2W2_9FLAO|nr:hypothetical protein [Salinimicrobium sediminis]SOC79673.1 hypothetical protein SAMN06296241_1205 [Salinimicrobium sediminis]